MREAWGHEAEGNHNLQQQTLLHFLLKVVTAMHEQPYENACPDSPAVALSEAQRTDLYVQLLRHPKATVAETAMYLACGESATQIARRRSCLGGDARAIENILYGRLLHGAPTWVRRTVRIARALKEIEGVEPDVVRNADAVLAQASLPSEVSRDLRELV